MSFGYPVMLEIRGRRCVVIGELAVGEGKVEGLLAAGADDVVVIGPEVDDRFEGVAGVTVEARAWGAAARQAALLVGARPNCDWAAPAVGRRGDLVLAIGTGGVSPAVARLVRQRLESSFGPEWAELLRVVGEVRKETLAALPVFEERARRWREALDLDEAVELIGSGRDEELRSRLRERLLREAS